MRAECDVLVVGGGVSGVSAAVASARGGAATILVERNTCLGGIGYAGLINQICGLYGCGDSGPETTLNDGIAREIASALTRKQRPIRLGAVYVLPYQRDDLLRVLNGLCLSEAGRLAVKCNTAMVSVERAGNLINSVTLMKDGDRIEIHPKVVVDSSGSGEVSALAGAEFMLFAEAERQLDGFIVMIRGLKTADDALSIKVPYVIAEAIQKGSLPDRLRFTQFSAGEAPDIGYLKLSIASAHTDVRSDAIMLHMHLASVLPMFSGSYIADTSAGVMEREGRRVLGDYVLTEDDVLGARKFDDGVVKNAWPIEIWDRERGTVYRYIKNGDYYEIPLRCFRVKGMPNLLTAGRCISVSHEALGSTRVMGSCIAIGEQAGIEAVRLAMRQ